MHRSLSAWIAVAALCAGACGAEPNEGLDDTSEHVDEALTAAIVPVHALPPVNATRYCGNARLLVTGYFDSDPNNGLRRGYRGGVTVVEGGPAQLKKIVVTEIAKNPAGTASGDYAFNPTVRAGSVYVGQHQGTSRDTTLWRSRADISLKVHYELAVPGTTVSCPDVTFASP